MQGPTLRGLANLMIESAIILCFIVWMVELGAFQE